MQSTEMLSLGEELEILDTEMLSSVAATMRLISAGNAYGDALATAAFLAATEQMCEHAAAFPVIVETLLGGDTPAWLRCRPDLMRIADGVSTLAASIAHVSEGPGVNLDGQASLGWISIRAGEFAERLEAEIGRLDEILKQPEEV